MADDSSFAQLMTRLRSGDADAATEIFNRYARRLLALARAKLDGRVRQKTDPDDVLQSVFRSFFSRYAEGELELASWDSLWGLLAVITVRKCGHRLEYFHAARRDVQREVAAGQADESARASLEGIAREPTPSEVVVLAETVEQLMRGLDERDRRILELGLQGHRAAEISEQVGCTERTVHRVLGRIRKRLERMRADDAES
jgi:RNA polymerase sigma-70 factor (ECF subfamily)